LLHEAEGIDAPGEVYSGVARILTEGTVVDNYFMLCFHTHYYLDNLGVPRIHNLPESRGHLLVIDVRLFHYFRPHSRNTFHHIDPSYPTHGTAFTDSGLLSGFLFLVFY